MPLRKQVTPKTNTLENRQLSWTPQSAVVAWSAALPLLTLCCPWLPIPALAPLQGSPTPVCLQRYHQCPQKESVWQPYRQHTCFSPWSKQLQTGDFRESESLASTYAVLWEPLITQQIFLEPFVNELWLHLCGVWWQLCQKHPLCHCRAGPGTTQTPASALGFKHLGGHCLNPAMCSAACASPSASGE